ncbi:MAG: VapE family protein [Bacteroidales bacterium]|nr:VapE family protein [Bacteroidales bacterium]
MFVKPSQAKRVIEAQWEVRFNATTLSPEVRRKGDERRTYQPMDERLHNSLIWSVQEELPNCYRSLVDCYLNSDEVPMYYPLREYLRSLPAWDGRDRVGEVAARISTDELWGKVFRRWLRGAVKGWLCEEDSVEVFDCQIAPMLISERQGLGKSTFCRMLLPAKMRTYYTDKFDLTADAHSEKCLGEFALINMDEFDRYSERQMATLKNLMQLTEVRVKRPRSRVFTLMRRTAAFIGTSNQTELLTDPTGSRRFFCQMVEAPISREPIDHAQLYAQVLAELAAGKLTYFTKEEEAEIEEHNRAFYRHSPLAEAFDKSFVVGDGTDASQWLSATEIFETLKRESPRALQGVKIAGMGRQLRRLGVLKKRTARGVFYCVRRKAEEESLTQNPQKENLTQNPQNEKEGLTQNPQKENFTQNPQNKKEFLEQKEFLGSPGESCTTIKTEIHPLRLMQNDSCEPLML